MLGWHISVFRQLDGGANPAVADSPQGARLAVWSARLAGLGWLDTLVESGRAVDLGGCGYPSFYTLQAKTALPVIAAEPPDANETWVSGLEDTPASAWVGKTSVDAGVAKECKPEEWLIVEVWDES